MANGYAGYGVFQGLNEAYDAYRAREADIVAEEARAKEQAYQDEVRAREREQYEYGLSRRPMQEEAESIGLETARNELQYNQEMRWSPDAMQRAKQDAINESENIRQTLKKTGIQLNEAQLQQDEAKLRRYYEGLANKWAGGQIDLDGLIKSFNEEDDLESNNIDASQTRQNPDGSYTVVYEDGRKEEYANNDDVLKTLYMMSDPAFAKKVLLEEAAQAAELAGKMAKLTKEANDDMQARGEKFSDDARAEVQALYGKIFPGGIADFGKEGDDMLAQEIRSMAMALGRVHGYDLTKTSAAEIVAAISREAEKTMDTNPETRERRALERYEKLGVPDVQDLLGDPEITEVPDKGDPMYEPLMKQLKYEQAMGDVAALRSAVWRKYVVSGEGDAVNPKGELPGAKKNIPTTNLEMSDEEIASAQFVDDPESGYGVTPPVDAGLIPISEYIGLVASGLGGQGMSPALKKRLDAREKSLNQKQKKRIKRTVEKVYAEEFDKMDGRQKAGWFAQYGKFLPTRLRNQAQAKIPKELLANADVSF